MSVSTSGCGCTHVGPPVGGGVDFNSTTKLVAYATSNYSLTSTPQLIAFPDVRVDTLGEFDSGHQYFYPSNDGWYGVGGYGRFINVSLDDDGRYWIYLYKNTSVALFFTYTPAARSNQTVTAQFYNYLYLEVGDSVSIWSGEDAAQGDLIGVAAVYPDSVSNIFIHRVL